MIVFVSSVAVTSNRALLAYRHYRLFRVVAAPTTTIMSSAVMSSAGSAIR